MLALPEQVQAAQGKQVVEPTETAVASTVAQVRLENLAAGKPIVPPQPETVATAQAITLEQLGALIKITDIPAQASAEQIKVMFEQALITLQADGWKVILATDSKSAISVNQEKQEVIVPSSRILSSDKLKQLVAHEIGTHVARRVNGERSRLMLLGLGLDRYLDDEGVATMREQAIAGKAEDFSGLEGHLAVSLATDTGDGTPRNFREVYTIMERYFIFRALQEGKSQTVATSEAKTKAWNRCVRTFRGTPASIRGTCLTKDIFYREGNIGVWDVVKENPQEMLRFNVGKYNPANPRHLMVLEQIGITNADLATLGAN